MYPFTQLYGLHWYGRCCVTEQKHGHWRYAVNGRYHQRKCGFGVEWSLQAGLEKNYNKTGIKRELLGHVRKCKLSYFGHLCRYHGCQIAKTVVEEYVEERRRCIRPQKQCMDNIKMWTKWQYHIACGLSKTVRSRWRELVSDGGQRSNIFCRKEERIARVTQYDDTFDDFRGRKLSVNTPSLVGMNSPARQLDQVQLVQYAHWLHKQGAIDCYITNIIMFQWLNVVQHAHWFPNNSPVDCYITTNSIMSLRLWARR